MVSTTVVVLRTTYVLLVQLMEREIDSASETEKEERRKETVKENAISIIFLKKNASKIK